MCFFVHVFSLSYICLFCVCHSMFCLRSVCGKSDLFNRYHHLFFHISCLFWIFRISLNRYASLHLLTTRSTTRSIQICHVTISRLSVLPSSRLGRHRPVQSIRWWRLDPNQQRRRRQRRKGSITTRSGIFVCKCNAQWIRTIYGFVLG